MKVDAKMALDLIRNSVVPKEGEMTPVKLFADCEDQYLSYFERRKIDGLFYAQRAHLEDHPRWRVYRAIWNAQKEALQLLLNCCRREGIDVTVIKGAEYCERYFSSLPICRKGDVDLLISTDNVQALRRVMTDLGYVQGQFDTDRLEIIPFDQGEIAAYESGHYNLRSFAKLVRIPITAAEQLASPGWNKPIATREDYAIIVVSFDVSTNLSKDFSLSDVVNNKRHGVFEGSTALCAEDAFWYGASLYYLTIYWEQEKTPLSTLAELAALLKQEVVSFRWDYLEETVARYSLYPNVYYTLSFLNRFLDIGIDSQTINRFDPRKGSRSRDFGWQLPKLFGEIDRFPDHIY